MKVSRASLVLLFVSVVTLGGCAFGEIRLGDPFDRKWTLEQAQHRYTVLVRWSDFAKAKAFVAKENREAFLAAMEKLEDARFTDYESDTVELDDDKQKASMRVTYTLYTPSSPYEMEISETQEWTRDGLKNEWRVVSTFDEHPKMVSN